MMQYLNCDINKFTHIIHVADIHIRLTKRHDEYKKVFDLLYSEVEKSPKTTLVAILGDVFHNKTDLTPECVQMASEFFRRLADLRPTILIPGNHDLSLNNKNRLDSLTPIVEANKHPNLFYLLQSGLYKIGNILLNHYSIVDDYTKYIPFSNIPKKYLNECDYKIALFHGPVQGATTDVGYRVVSKTVANESFDGHDIVLLGDIHRHQRLQERSINYEKPMIVYPGSMIQQNHGESLDKHGYLLWDLQNYEYTLVELYNKHGFFTISIEDGELQTDITKNLPEQVTLRVKCKNSIPSEVKSWVNQISNKSEVLEVAYERIDTNTEVKNIIDTTNINVNSISDVDYQNELIKSYFVKKSISLPNDVIEQVMDINKRLNGEIKKENIIRNIRWKPKKFEFENMFSYGEGNVVNFENIKGTVGLFAKNCEGKSSILNALSYCLFDKCPTAFKAAHILNTQKMSFNCKFNFSIDGIDYYIERKGNQDKKGNVKVEVKFYKIENEIMLDLNGDARRDTNDVIRDYIGTYDDFILTVLSIQNSGGKSNFVDLGQAERKDLIANFMGITIYDQLDSLAKTENKEIATLLKNYSKANYPKLLADTIQDISALQPILINDEILENSNSSKLQLKREQYERNRDKIKPTTARLVDIDTANKKLNIVKENRDSLYKKNDYVTSQITKISDLLEAELHKKDKYVEDKIEEKYQAYTKLLQDKQVVDSNILRESEIIDLNSISKNKLCDIKYNESCEVCISTHKKVIAQIESLNKDISVRTSLLETMKDKKTDISSKISACGDISEEYKLYIKNIESIKQLKDSLHTYKLENLNNKNSIQSMDSEILNIEKQIEEYNTEKSSIEHNNEINKVLNTIQADITGLEREQKVLASTIQANHSRMAVLAEQKKTYEDNIGKIKKWELQQESYNYYLSAISRDGIPYDLISQALPTIEKEVNSILLQIVDFQLDMRTDGKNITCALNYGGKSWPIEMSSGLERFVTSLAIRVALINISNLPRPNFIAIDEGWGCADRENLNSMGSLLHYLKSNFDFVWVISHLDTMKDMVDSQLEIKKERGFSKIVSI